MGDINKKAAVKEGYKSMLGTLEQLAERAEEHDGIAAYEEIDYTLNYLLTVAIAQKGLLALAYEKDDATELGIFGEDWCCVDGCLGQIVDLVFDLIQQGERMSYEASQHSLDRVIHFAVIGKLLANKEQAENPLDLGNFLS